MALLRLTFKNIVSNWIRFLLTALAVILGVGFVVGTFVVTDGLRSTFGDLAEDIASGADLFVQADQEFGDERLAQPIAPEVIEQIGAIDGVASAEGIVFRPGVNVVGGDGETIGEGFTAGLSFGPANATFLVTEGEYAGRAPDGGDEFALNASAVEDGDLSIGSTYQVDALGGTRDMTLVGAFNWADPDDDKTVGGLLVGFDLDTALDFLVDNSGLTQVGVNLESSADEVLVQAAVADLVGSDFEVITNETSAEEQEADFDEFLDIFGNILLAFAIVTLVVSAFIIYNTFSIVVGQRVRELGLLRAIGASGRQVAGSLIGEAVVVGVAATIVGIVSGVGVAWVLRTVLEGLGGNFPDGPLPIKSRTIIVALLMGIGVTVISAVVPAMKARRVPPIAALRDDVTVGVTTVKLHPRLGKLLIGLGLLALAGGVASGGGIAPLGFVAALLLYFGGSRTKPFLGRASLLFVGIVLLVVAAAADLDTSALLGALSLGALLTFVGVNLVSPLFAKPLSSLIGTKSLGIVVLILGIALGVGAAASAVFTIIRLVDTAVGPTIGYAVLTALAAGGAALCLTTWRAPWGVEGRMGTGNAGRTPRRTSSTAAALMIGLALVGTVSVIGSSIKTTFDSVLDRSVNADWFICLDDCSSFFDGFSPEFASEIQELTSGDDRLLDSVVSYRFAEEAFRTPDGDVHDVLTADFERLDEHVDADFIEGSPASSGPGDILLHEDPAKDRNLSVGDEIELEFASGEIDTFRVGGIYTDARILGNWAMTNDDYGRLLPPGEDQFVSAVSAGGADEAVVRAELEEVAAAFPDVEVRTKDEFRDSQADQIDQALIVINVFLVLALIIALVGIANTLALSVFERTREIGLFRGVGATRKQTSVLIRWEGAIIAVFGGILGIVLGIVFGIVAVIVIPDSIVSDISIPTFQLIAYLIVAALAGLVAAYLPARRASRLNVLDAIAERG